MKKNVVLAAAVFVIAFSVFAQTPSATELLKRVDDNEVYDTIQYTGQMIIEYKKKTYTKEFITYARGANYSYMEFTNAEDAGTKMLKRENRLYVYSPDTEQVEQIMGAALRRSIMNSDMSYEDSVENEGLSARYAPALAASESRDGRDCWILDLTELKKNSQSYPRRKLWIDKQTGDLVHYELYAPSGKAIKEYTLLDVQVIGGVRFPSKAEIRDLNPARQGSKTTFIMNNIVLNKPIDDNKFSERALERN